MVTTTRRSVLASGTTDAAIPPSKDHPAVWIKRDGSPISLASMLGLRDQTKEGDKLHGLLNLLPRLRAPSTRRDAHSSRATDPDASAAAKKAERRNARKAEKAKRPEWRHKPRGHRPGVLGLLAAIQAA